MAGAARFPRSGGSGGQRRGLARGADAGHLRAAAADAAPGAVLRAVRTRPSADARIARPASTGFRQTMAPRHFQTLRVGKLGIK